MLLVGWGREFAPGGNACQPARCLQTGLCLHVVLMRSSSELDRILTDSMLGNDCNHEGFKTI